MAGQRPVEAQIARSDCRPSESTQIYEGTNQIQKVVMARALLRG